MNFRQKIKENQVSNISIYSRDIHSITFTSAQMLFLLSATTFGEEKK